MPINVTVEYAGPVGRNVENGGRELPAIISEWQRNTAGQIVIDDLRRHEALPEPFVAQYGAWISVKVPAGTAIRRDAMEPLLRAVHTELHWDRIGPGTSWGSNLPLLVEVGDNDGHVECCTVALPKPNFGYHAPSFGSGVRIVQPH